MTAPEKRRLLAGRRILVVEDEYFLADDIASALREGGAEVIGPIAEGRESLNVIAHSGALDCAVLDINLQGEMVYPVAEALRERGVPFVFSTGYAKGSIAKEYEHVPRWEKPYDAATLVLALPALVGPRKN